MRRLALGVLVSIGVHAVIVVGAVGLSAWRGLSLGRGVELVPITLEEVKELPLGPPPAGAAGEEEGGQQTPAPVRRRARPKAPRTAGTLAMGGPDAGAAPRPDGGAPARAVAAQGSAGPRKGDLRGYGPEGSRLTALLRLDRLRAAPEARATIAAVDEILRLLPDRRRLLDGTGLDLYRDFDALLIATPNPFDDTVTFLAARHRLADAELRAALDRAAVAGGRAIDWREEAGRPVGVRRAAEGDRDDRLFVLPEPGLAVIAPPAYARLLLGPTAPAGGDAGAPASRAGWTDLVARIDAEDGAMPEDAVFLLTATNLIRGAGGDTLRPVPGTRGSVDEESAPVRPAIPPLPRVLSLAAGVAPTTFLELTAEFGAAAQAAAWEMEWPAWKAKLLGNPLVLLAGLNPIVSRAELRRDDATVLLRTTATGEETRRVLQMIVNFARSGGAL